MLLIILELIIALSVVYGQTNPNCADGKNVIIQYVGWKWTDIEKECASSPLNSFTCAIQIPPPYEHEKITLDSGSNPWYQRWSIVGYYKTLTDSGNRTAWEAMVETCVANGIQVFVDFEVNHMTPDGNPGPCYGSSGSYYDGRDDPTFAIPSYSTVPFNREDFHLAGDAVEGCPTSSGAIENPADPEQVWRCKYRYNRTSYDVDGNYNDLKSDGEDYVPQIVEELNLAIDFGVTGFKFSFARWVRPEHLELVATGANDLPSAERPFIYSETVDFKDGVIPSDSYMTFGRIEEVMAGYYLSEMAIRNRPLTQFESWGDPSSTDFDLVASDSAIVYVDDPFRQRNMFLDSFGNSYPVVTFRQEREYIVANSLMLSHPYGMKKVLSSFDWEQDIVGGEDLNDWQGPPMTDGVNVDDVFPTNDSFGRITLLLSY